MVERFGMQDHSPQVTQHALQNPTNSSSFPNIGGGDYSAGSSTSGGGGGSYVAYTGPTGPYTKGYIKAVLLAALFGPFGLYYTSWRGATFMIALFAAVGYFIGGENFFNREYIMGPMAIVGRSVSTVWTIFAARAYNRKALGKDTEDVAK